MMPGSAWASWASSSCSLKPGLAGKVADRLLAERRADLRGLDRRIGAGPDPGIDGLAMAGVLEFLHEVGQAAEQAAARRRGARLRRGRGGRGAAAAEQFAEQESAGRDGDRVGEVAAGHWRL